MVSSVLESVLAVFTAIANWFVSTINALVPIFYADNNLTFIGTLAACGVGVGIIMLVINLVRRFLRFK